MKTYYEQMKEKYGKRWEGKDTSSDEYVKNCTDPEEIRTLWNLWAPQDDGYWEHNYGALCWARLDELKGKD